MHKKIMIIYPYFGGGKMNGFVTIENHLFNNHLMHDELNFKMHIFLFISLLKHVNQDKWSGSSNITHLYRWA